MPKAKRFLISFKLELNLIVYHVEKNIKMKILMVIRFKRTLSAYVALGKGIDPPSAACSSVPVSKKYHIAPLSKVANRIML